MKPEYANLTRIQFFKSADYYGMSHVYENLYSKSTKNINVKNIMPLIKDKRNMLIAIRCIKSNKGADTAGIDKLTFTELLQTNSIDELHTKVCSLIDNYHSSGVRRVYIPKSNGKLRPLGIPNAIDKLIQQMIKQVLEPYCEGKFHQHSYGFRPTRGVGEVIARCHHLVTNARCTYCVDIDIQGFFDNVHHNRLIKQMWNLGIRDKRVLQLVKKIIKAPVDGEIPSKGTPQGGILSPLLSNIVLNELDHWVSRQWEQFYDHSDTTKHKDEFYKELKYKVKIPNPNHRTNSRKRGEGKWIRKWKTLKTGFIVRYADDFKIFTPNYEESIRWYFGVKQFIEKRLHLNISEEKSKIVNLKKNKSKFLGFELKAINTFKRHKQPRNNVNNKTDKFRYRLSVRLGKDKLKEIVEKYRSILDEFLKNRKDERKIISKLNTAIVGWQNYCRLGTYPTKDMSQVYSSVFGKLKRLENYHGHLKKISMRKAKEKSSLIANKYANYNGSTFESLDGIVICPIWAIKQKRLSQRKPDISPYNRNDLIEYWYKELGWDNSEAREVVNDYCNNKWVNSLVSVHALSLFTSQYGKCSITSIPLSEGFDIHHKIARADGGNDTYVNLVMLNPYAHKLVHAKKQTTIQKYIKWIKSLGGKINKSYMNKLRKQLNLELIQVNAIT